MKKRMISLLLLLATSLSLFGCSKARATTTATDQPRLSLTTTTVTLPVGMTKEQAYQQAIGLLEAKQYEDAYSLFLTLGDYGDAAAYASRFHWVPTRIGDADEKSDRTRTFDLGPNNLPLALRVTFPKDDQDQYVLFLLDEGCRLTNRLSVDGQKILSQDTYTYDEDGNLTSSVKSGHGLTSYSTVKHTYKDGLLIHTSGTGEGIVDGRWGRYSYTYDYAYNSRGELISKESKIGSSHSLTTYTYNGRGDLALEEYTDLKKETKDVTAYTYDSRGHLIRKERTSLDTNTESVTTYAYDSRGHLIREEYKNPDEVVHTLTLYTYNSYGELTCREQTNYITGTKAGTTYAYDLYGNVTRIGYTRNNVEIEYRSYTYDQHGNLTRDYHRTATSQKVYSFHYTLVYIDEDLSKEAVRQLFWDCIGY